MPRLRQRMLEDLQGRNDSPHTIRGYILAVKQFAGHFSRSPRTTGCGRDPSLSALPASREEARPRNGEEPHLRLAISLQEDSEKAPSGLRRPALSQAASPVADRAPPRGADAADRGRAQPPVSHPADAALRHRRAPNGSRFRFSVGRGLDRHGGRQSLAGHRSQQREGAPMPGRCALGVPSRTRSPSRARPLGYIQCQYGLNELGYTHF
jgi:hypothetical protein